LKNQELSLKNQQLNSKTKELNFTLRYGTAKDRIHNHLSYKLGQAMIENSKSLLGYIRMPYVLSYIKDKHKQEQQQYQEAIKKNPNLKLPNLESYPDYKESLKEKECLTYKLGEAFIKADKTWYKGGYVKLWFEVRRLRGERK
ncbi:MAG: alpha-2,3-sialyltransferase, partial [Helicobacter sp.]|nr:alpha-2,3-sialyltransferase [Helicobacter sp.]